MYLPIANIYNKYGVMSGVRFFQWFKRGEKTCSIYTDSLVTSLNFEDIQLIDFSRCNIAVLSVEEIFGYNMDDVVFNQDVVHCTKERYDGTFAVEYLILLGAYLSRTERRCMVIDGKGRYNFYNENTIVWAQKHDKIFIGNRDMTTEARPLVGIKYLVSKEWLHRCEAFQQQVSLLGGAFQYKYGNHQPSSDSMPEYFPVKGEVVVVPDIVCKTVISDTTTSKLAFQGKFGNVEIDDMTGSLRQVLFPECVSVFKVSTNSKDLEVRLPKYTMPWGDTMAVFVFSAPVLQDNLEVIDQSGYFCLVSNSWELEKNNIKKFILAAGCIETKLTMDTYALQDLIITQGMWNGLHWDTSMSQVRLSLYCRNDFSRITLNTCISSLTVSVIDSRRQYQEVEDKGCSRVFYICGSGKVERLNFRFGEARPRVVVLSRSCSECKDCSAHGVLDNSRWESRTAVSHSQREESNIIASWLNKRENSIDVEKANCVLFVRRHWGG